LGQRLHVALRGIESLAGLPAAASPVRSAALSGEIRRGPLPLGEMFHPAALAALAVLVANDWWAKRAHPSWLTGKLSDVAGLVVAPLALTAAAGALLWLAMALGAPIDPSLRRRRLLLAIAAVAAPFLATKLSEPAAGAVAELLALVGGQPRIVCDPTDLLALPALWIAWRIGQAELRLVPRGRAHALWRQARPRASALADVRAAGADPEAVDTLERGLADRDPPRVDAALATLARAPRHPR
jgi:hypothetical protein